MKIQTNKYTYLIVLVIVTLLLFTISFFLLSKIWERKPETNNTSNSSSALSTQNISNSTESSSSASMPLFTSEGVEKDKYYSEVLKLTEEYKKLVTTGKSDYINPNNKDLLYSDSEEHFFEDFVRLEKDRVEDVTKNEISKVNLPAFCSDLVTVTNELETQLEIALKGYDVPLVKKVEIDGLYSFDIYDPNEEGKYYEAGAYILVNKGKAKFIDEGRWVWTSQDEFLGPKRMKALVLKCDID